MGNVSNKRAIAPNTTSCIFRRALVESVLNSGKRSVYIHAGAGYGKTTLLSQAAEYNGKSIWLTMDCECDVSEFVSGLVKAVQYKYPEYNFHLPGPIGINERNELAAAAKMLAYSMECLDDGLVIILDDLHTTKDPFILEFISRLLKYLPDGIRILVGSRNAPDKHFSSMLLKNEVYEITSDEMKFSCDEVSQILGVCDEDISGITAGWPLAVNTCRTLLDNGVLVGDIPENVVRMMYPYMMYECIDPLPEEIRHFLELSAAFNELDIGMLSAVLKMRNVRETLEYLKYHNVFIYCDTDGRYRYHPIMRGCLQMGREASAWRRLYSGAASYYCDSGDYTRAVDNAVLAEDNETLAGLIKKTYRSCLKSCRFTELGEWLDKLDDAYISNDRRLLTAKCALLSTTGDFAKAARYLDLLIPLVSEDDGALYVEVMLYKARTLRSIVSIEKSDLVLDRLVQIIGSQTSEIAYSVVVEKLYNLCLESRVNEAYGLAAEMIEKCLDNGDLRYKAWYERYLCVIHCFAGRVSDAVISFEKSGSIPKEDCCFLDLHNIGMFAAKAYMMNGSEEKAIPLILSETDRIKASGRSEELWLAYLIASEIYFQKAYADFLSSGKDNAFEDKGDKRTASCEEVFEYIGLAWKYASRYHDTGFESNYVKIYRLVYKLLFLRKHQDSTMNEIFKSLDNIAGYLKTFLLEGMSEYFYSVSDVAGSAISARQCIEEGEKYNTMLYPAFACGVLAKTAIESGDDLQAAAMTARCLKLCTENGTLVRFRIQSVYGPILEYASNRGMEPNCVRHIMAITGYTVKKAYVQTFGGVFVYSLSEMREPIRMRTKKERELLAFLLAAGKEGANKNQIHRALWSDSESDDIKKLIGVNLAHLKKDLAGLDIQVSVINLGGHYSICTDEIVIDTDLFKKAAGEFQRLRSKETAQKLISLYKGEYLMGYEALWATGRRVAFSDTFKTAFDFLKENRGK